VALLAKRNASEPWPRIPARSEGRDSRGHHPKITASASDTRDRDHRVPGFVMGELRLLSLNESLASIV
jgi:hypothetical protein